MNEFVFVLSSFFVLPSLEPTSNSMNPPARRPRLPFSGLGLLLLLEIAVFGVVSTNFFTRQNAFEIGRLCVEIGLLALALTPVIITGGIDLSAGSLLGLSAVVLGMLWRDAGWPVAVAALAAVITGGLGGLL